MISRACTAAAVALAAIPATAGAATVSVTEETVGTFPPHERSTLLFEAAPGEDNIATIVPAGEENGKVRYEVRDLHVPLAAGPGCTGGGGRDTPVICLMSRSRPASCQHLGCTDLGSQIVFRFLLGDGDDELRAGQVPVDDGGGGSVTVEADGGIGDDQLYPGPTDDILDPGPGADSVRSNQGNDFVDAGDSPDGPDYFDLRDGFDTITYRDAGAPVNISIDARADDGAPGEGDTVVDAEELVGTPGPDTLTGGNGTLPGPDGYAEALVGGGGGDLLIGNGGPDLLYAASLGFPIAGGGDDLLRGGRGNDLIQAFSGGDRAFGGAGADGLFLDDGDDLGSGGAGNDSVNGDPGSDRLDGGTGRDRLDGGFIGGSGDGAADRLDCGPGEHDHAFDAEPADRVRRCERTYTGLS
jgi:hypothetical protein